MTRIPLFPLDAVVFPGEVVPLHVFEDRYCALVEDCIDEDRPIGIALADDHPDSDIIERDAYRVGTAAAIRAVEQLPDGRYIVVAEGFRRFLIRGVTSDRLYQEADVEWLDEPAGGHADDAAEAVRAELHRLYAEEVLDEVLDPVEASYVVAAALGAPLLLEQRLLEAPDAAERLRLELALLSKVAPVAGGLN